MMATIDIDTETGNVKLPMRRVTGIEEVRVRAWIELVTLLGEWQTNIESGIDFDQIFDGAEDQEIEDDVATRISLLPNVQSIDVVITRATDDNGLYSLAIEATVTALGELVVVTTGVDI